MTRKERIKEYFNTIAKSYTRYQKKFKYYYNDISKYFNFYLNENNSILEIGCGNGSMLSRLKGNNKVGIDFSEEMINEAKKLFPDLEFHVQDAENINLNKKFDVIILSGVIGYIDNLTEVFDSLKDVCFPHTRILISYYNFLWEPFLKFAEFLHLKMKQPFSNWLSTKDVEGLCTT